MRHKRKKNFFIEYYNISISVYYKTKRLLINVRLSPFNCDYSLYKILLIWNLSPTFLPTLFTSNPLLPPQLVEEEGGDRRSLQKWKYSLLRLYIRSLCQIYAYWFRIQVLKKKLPLIFWSKLGPSHRFK